MTWQVSFTRKAEKQAERLPSKQLEKLKALVHDMGAHGPVRTNWANYSKLNPGEHHCHLSYRYVACWKVIDNRIQILEVFYVGTREGAPY